MVCQSHGQYITIQSELFLSQLQIKKPKYVRFIRVLRSTREDLKYSFPIQIIVQRDATQSSLFMSLQVHSKCFGCQAHPSSVHKTVTTASGTGHIFLQVPPSNVAMLGHRR